MKILEREAPLRDLKGWLDEAASGRGRIVFLGGEAGIGKTVLIRVFTQSIEGLARAAIGRCDPLSTPRALGPLLDAAGTLGGGIGSLIEAGAAQEELFHAVLAALATSPRPTLLVLEDVHWADGATLDLLRFLGRRIGGTRGVVVASYRDDEVGPRHPLTAVLGDVATSEGVRRLTLPALTLGAVESLARGSGFDPAELHARTGGNPFFVTECLAGGLGQAVPATVRDAVLARVSRLSPQAQEVLETAAVVGPEAALDVLRQAAGEAMKALDEVLASGVLRGEEHRVGFRHELARQAILTALPPQRGEELHRRVLDALLASPGADPADLAHHAEAAGDGDRTLAYASDAARRAVSLGAHREASAQYARALRSAGDLPPAARAELLEAYAEESGVVDQMEMCLDALAEAIAIRRREGAVIRAAADLTKRSSFALRAGRNDEVEQNIRSALDLLSPLPPSIELARAVRTMAYVRMVNRDNAEAITWGERAIELAGQFADAHTIVGAHNAMGSALLLEGDTERGVQHLELSKRLAEENGLSHDVGLAYINLGSALGEVFQLPQADGYLARGLAYCLEHDLDQSRYYIIAWQALSHFYQGRWAEAERDAVSVSSVPRANAISRITALIALGRLLTRRGDRSAGDALDEALVLAERTATLQRLGPVRAARAESAWLKGDLSSVIEEARSGFDLATRHRHAWFGGELAYWLWTAGALEVVPGWLAEPHALQLGGRWEDAAAAWERLGCPYEQARALAHAQDEAALRRAHQIFERLGARPMAAIVARRLREAGVRNIPRGPRPSTRAHPAGLTSREVEIVALLADGLRNPEIARRLFLSAKTVDHHVSSILAKLGVRSRAEVVREAARLGLIERG